MHVAAFVPGDEPRFDDLPAREIEDVHPRDRVGARLHADFGTVPAFAEHVGGLAVEKEGLRKKFPELFAAQPFRLAPRKEGDGGVQRGPRDRHGRKHAAPGGLMALFRRGPEGIVTEPDSLDATLPRRFGDSLKPGPFRAEKVAVDLFLVGVVQQLLGLEGGPGEAETVGTGHEAPHAGARGEKAGVRKGVRLVVAAEIFAHVLFRVKRVEKLFGDLRNVLPAVEGPVQTAEGRVARPRHGSGDRLGGVPVLVPRAGLHGPHGDFGIFRVHGGPHGGGEPDEGVPHQRPPPAAERMGFVGGLFQNPRQFLAGVGAPFPVGEFRQMSFAETPLPYPGGVDGKIVLGNDEGGLGDLDEKRGVPRKHLAEHGIQGAGGHGRFAPVLADHPVPSCVRPGLHRQRDPPAALDPRRADGLLDGPEELRPLPVK